MTFAIDNVESSKLVSYTIFEIFEFEKCCARNAMRIQWNAPKLHWWNFLDPQNTVAYGGWFVPCRVIVFSGRKGEKAPRENSPNVDFFVFSHGDLSPRNAKIRHFMPRLFASCLSYLCLAGRKVATRKPANWWLFRVFAWRPFAPPHESTRHSMRCVFGYRLSYLCLARRKVAMRKPDKITFWRVIAWRPFAFSPRKHVYTTWHTSATIVATCFMSSLLGVG